MLPEATIKRLRRNEFRDRGINVPLTDFNPHDLNRWQMKGWFSARLVTKLELAVHFNRWKTPTQKSFPEDEQELKNILSWDNGVLRMHSHKNVFQILANLPKQSNISTIARCTLPMSELPERPAWPIDFIEPHFDEFARQKTMEVMKQLKYRHYELGYRLGCPEFMDMPYDPLSEPIKSLAISYVAEDFNDEPLRWENEEDDEGKPVWQWVYDQFKDNRHYIFKYVLRWTTVDQEGNFDPKVNFDRVTIPIGNCERCLQIGQSGSICVNCSAEGELGPTLEDPQPHDKPLPHVYEFCVGSGPARQLNPRVLQYYTVVTSELAFQHDAWLYPNNVATHDEIVRLTLDADTPEWKHRIAEAIERLGLEDMAEEGNEWREFGVYEKHDWKFYQRAMDEYQEAKIKRTQPLVLEEEQLPKKQRGM